MRKLDGGTPMKRLSDEIGVEILTICNARKQKKQLLKCFADSDVLNLIANMRTLYQSKTVDTDNVRMEFFDMGPKIRKAFGLMLSE
jgi:hypothetical protein